MTDNQFISVRETAQLLGVTEKKVMDMIDLKELQAYRIANQFLRLKKAEVLSLKNTGTVEVETTVHPYTVPERLSDFFYYNDFYIVCVAVIGVLLYIIFFH